MLFYHLRLAAGSLGRHPAMTALIVGGIALGITISTTFITLYHVMSKNPIPAKSDALHAVRLDGWDPTRPHPHPSGIPPQLTWRDGQELLRSEIPTRQVLMYKARLYVYPDAAQAPEARPTREEVRVTGGDFFEMFQTPFRYGTGWDEAADARPEAVAVIDAELNDRLFGGADSVGRAVRIEQQDFRIVGVLDSWRPLVKFYDLTQNPLSEPESVFIPLGWTLPMDIFSSGNNDGWAFTEGETRAEQLASSETVWLQMWVELEDAEQRAAYQDFLNAYAREQRELGRFQRPFDNRVTPLMQYMEEERVVPEEAGALAVVSVLFLVVCSLNLIGLFLGKFLARAPVVGVRRALGASRWMIFQQHLVECELAGFLGGLVGLALTLPSLALLNRMLEKLLGVGGFARLDSTMVLAAVLLSLVAGLIAGLYPAWRICRVAPARHLKMQ